MAAAKFTFNGKNYTEQGWHFALYQKYPQELGLKSIAWKQLVLSKSQTTDPTHGSISWSMDFKVTVAKQQSGDIYTGGVELVAKEGYNYEAVMDGGYVQINEIGKGNPGYINFKNNTKSKQNLGLEIDGSLVALQEVVPGGVNAQFQITPTYYLGLFSNLTIGSLVSSDVEVGPVEIKIPDGKNTVEVDAVNKEGVDSLSPPKYSYGDAMLSTPRYT